MDTKLKTQLLAAMNAYMQTDNGECCCEMCKAQAEADDDKGRNPLRRYDTCPVDKAMKSALAALEAAPVDDIAEAFNKAQAALTPSLGEKFALSVVHEAIRYASGRYAHVWSVSAATKVGRWVAGDESDTMEKSLNDLLTRLDVCDVCGGKQGGKYAHVHVEMT